MWVPCVLHTRLRRDTSGSTSHPVDPLKERLSPVLTVNNWVYTVLILFRSGDTDWRSKHPVPYLPLSTGWLDVPPEERWERFLDSLKPLVAKNLETFLRERRCVSDGRGGFRCARYTAVAMPDDRILVNSHDDGEEITVYHFSDIPGLLYGEDTGSRFVFLSGIPFRRSLSAWLLWWFLDDSDSYDGEESLLLGMIHR